MEEVKRHLKVVIGSPGDVQGERDSLAQVFEDLNRGVASERGFHLDLLRWEMDAFPRFHEQGPQGAIDESLRIQDCDIIIGMFWARFGTPVSDASSGTEHELQIAYESWKKTKRPNIMLYFRSQPFFPKTEEETDQLGRVYRFKKKFAQEAIYGDYQDVDDFKRRVSNDLTQLLRALSPGDTPLGKALKQPPPAWRHLEKARSIDWASMRLGDLPLYTFSGLRVDARDEDVVQDFRIDRGRHDNPNPVSYLWADVYRGNSVTASVEEGDPPHLGVTFENKPASWASNVAIRPISERAVTTRGRSILAFETRLAPESPPEIFVSVRVANGFCQHWAYGADGRYLLFQVTETWNPIEIWLTRDERWWLFAVDGNYAFGPQNPDFSLISSVVLVFGGPGMNEPGPGRGTVLIRNVHLRERETGSLPSDADRTLLPAAEDSARNS
jgi:hypothetical protein